jgi:type II secretory pathway component GspD/PulD (secretin)
MANEYNESIWFSAIKALFIGTLMLGLIFILILPVSSLEQTSKYHFVDASLWDVLNALAEDGGYHMVVGGDQAILKQKRVSLNLSKTSAIDALQNLLDANGYAYDVSGKNILISTLSQDLRQSGLKREGEEIRLTHLSAKRVKDALSPLFADVKFEEGPRPQTLLVWSRSSDFSEVMALIEKLDQPSPRVLIEAQVLELTESGSHKWGARYGSEQEGGINFSVNRNTGKGSLASDLQISVSALIAAGDANLVARPKIAALDGEKALINIGDKIPYAVPSTSSGGAVTWSVQYIDAGVRLEILPRVGKKNLTINLKPEVSAITEWRITAAGEFPVIATRNAETTVSIKDGESIVIGGLINENERHNNYRIPLISNIPVLGLLFQYDAMEKSKTEIVFVITPKLI